MCNDIIWLWPCERKGCMVLECLFIFDYKFVYIYYISSPYLLMFGDDHVRGTRE